MSSASSHRLNQLHTPGEAPKEKSSLPSLTIPTWKMLALALAAAVIVFLIGASLDWFVIHEKESRTAAIGISDVLAGSVAGALMFRLLQYERERRRRIRKRLETVADMNHHVRNALQVISMTAYSAADQQQLQAIRASVDRIQWALREILPKL